MPPSALLDELDELPSSLVLLVEVDVVVGVAEL
jgi:hypothetical protein